MINLHQFGDAFRFSESRAAVSRPGSGRTGYIDSSGSLVISDLFVCVRDFSEGRAAVAVETPKGLPWWGYIDSSDKCTVRSMYADAKSLHQGRAWVLEESGIRGFINQ